MQKSSGFIVPLLLVGLLLVGSTLQFARLQLMNTPSEQRVDEALEVVRFWQAAAMNFLQKQGRWPVNLAELSSEYALPAPVFLKELNPVNGHLQLTVQALSATHAIKVKQALANAATLGSQDQVVITVLRPNSWAVTEQVVGRTALTAKPLASDIDLGGNRLVRVSQIYGRLASYTREGRLQTNDLKGSQINSFNGEIDFVYANSTRYSQAQVGGYDYSTEFARAQQLYQAIFYCYHVTQNCRSGAVWF